MAENYNNNNIRIDDVTISSAGSSIETIGINKIKDEKKQHY